MLLIPPRRGASRRAAKVGVAVSRRGGRFFRLFCLQPPTYRNAEHATERTDRNGELIVSIITSLGQDQTERACCRCPHHRVYLSCIFHGTKKKELDFRNTSGYIRSQMPIKREQREGELEMGKTVRRGRPREVVEAVSSGLLIPKDLCERLDRVASKIGISRSQLIRNLVEVGIGEVEAMDALGLIGMMNWMRAIQEKLHERVASSKLQATPNFT